MPDQGRTLRFRVARMEAFSDGVFAIAITLLVLDLGVPATTGDLPSALGAQWPAYLAYVISFASIGGVWLAHAAITDALAGASSVLLRLNLLLLLLVSFLPFPTRLLAEHLEEQDAARTAVTLYGVVLLLIAGTVAALWRYAVRDDLVKPALNDDLVLLTRQLTPGLAGYLLMILLGLLLPRVAVVGYLFVSLLLLVPPHLFGLRRSTWSR